MHIILSIPGPWDDVTALAQAIATTGCGYRLQDGVLSDASYTCRLELSDHDVELRQSFKLANRHSLSHADLEHIAVVPISSARADRWMRDGSRCGRLPCRCMPSFLRHYR